MENTTGEEPFHLTYPNVNERKYVTSQDEFRKRLKILAKKIELKVYEHGFLLK